MQTQYIVLNVLEESTSDILVNHLQEEIFAQQMHISNLISFLIEYQSDAHVAALIEQLVSIKGVYDRMTSSGQVTGDQMKDLKTAVSAIRTKIIS